MADPQIFLLAAIFLVTAFLYASVGQAGGTGYLAAMGLLGIAPAVMKPTALILNILVATIASVSYARAGCFSWRRFWPFAVTSIPFAFLGGSLHIPAQYYRVVVGAVLIYAAYRLAFLKNHQKTAASHPFSLPQALVIGAGIGLLAGITGIGGGIFLAPLLLFLGWVDFGRAAGISAVFILVNSISGLSGNLASVHSIPQEVPYWIAAVAIGGAAGAAYGSRHLNSQLLVRILALVMVIGGIKMLFL